MQFDEQAYLASDRIEHYCLGLLNPDEARAVEETARLYPAVRDTINELTLALVDYATAEPTTPKPALKSRIMTALNELAEPTAFALTNLPLLNAYSDADQWARTVAPIQPPAEYRNVYGQVLRQDKTVTQFLVWIRHEIRPEDHHDEHESFLILEGRCECSIGGERIELASGDYVAIPLDLEHTVRVTSETPVKAIIQRVKVA